MAEILINSVVKESEKAMLINIPVSWNGKMYPREFWFPKSVIESITGKCANIKSWFLDKMSVDKSYQGYRMDFEYFA